MPNFAMATSCQGISKFPNRFHANHVAKELITDYYLQVRGTSGEHTESIGGVYDISNIRRLGLTEFQAVKEMQDGILELIKIEKSM